MGTDCWCNKSGNITNIQCFSSADFNTLSKGGPHCTSGETEAQKGEATCPRSSSRPVTEPGIESGLPSPSPMLYPLGHAASNKYFKEGLFFLSERRTFTRGKNSFNSLRFQEKSTWKTKLLKGRGRDKTNYKIGTKNLTEYNPSRCQEGSAARRALEGEMNPLRAVCVLINSERANDEPSLTLWRLHNDLEGDRVSSS